MPSGVDDIMNGPGLRELREHEQATQSETIKTVLNHCILILVALNMINSESNAWLLHEDIKRRVDSVAGDDAYMHYYVDYAIPRLLQNMPVEAYHKRKALSEVAYGMSLGSNLYYQSPYEVYMSLFTSYYLHNFWGQYERELLSPEELALKGRILALDAAIHAERAEPNELNERAELNELNERKDALRHTACRLLADFYTSFYQKNDEMTNFIGELSRIDGSVSAFYRTHCDDICTKLDNHSLQFDNLVVTFERGAAHVKLYKDPGPGMPLRREDENAMHALTDEWIRGDRRAGILKLLLGPCVLVDEDVDHREQLGYRQFYHPACHLHVRRVCIHVPVSGKTDRTFDMQRYIGIVSQPVDDQH